MIVDRCPRCSAHPVRVGILHAVPYQTGSDARFFNVVNCPVCLKNFVAITNLTDQVIQVYPFVESSVDASVPREIADDFSEAATCLSAGCFKASMVMSRRALQRCLKEHGCDQNKLADAIDHALQSGIIRKPFHVLATEIRQYGNLGAHPDDDQLANCNKESAEHVLEFTRMMIHEFYEVPASAAALRKHRT